MPQKYPRIWIASQALSEMEAEGKRCFPLETGGVLVGYRAMGSQVITAVIGPGPRAVHTRSSFEADHEYQCDLLDTHFENSGRVAVYLGDWHTHPGATPSMSATDRLTIRAIAAHAPARCPDPLMVIGGGGPSVWHWMAHTYNSNAYVRHLRSRPLAILG